MPRSQEGARELAANSYIELIEVTDSNLCKFLIGREKK